MIYFTPDFEALITDVEGYVGVLLAETNEGYFNSKIPVRVSLFCIEKLNIAESWDASLMLDRFGNAKGK